MFCRIPVKTLLFFIEDPNVNVVVSQPAEPKQDQTDKGSYSVSEIKIHSYSDSKEKTANNQKRNEKQNISSNIRGKKHQVVEQQRVNLDQLQYIYKLEARVKELEQTLSLSNRRKSLNSDSVSCESTVLTPRRHDTHGRETENGNNVRLQIESLEMKVKQLEVNNCHNLYLMSMNNSQINSQLQTQAFMMQNCQMQQLYAFSLQAGKFQPPVLNYNPFGYGYPFMYNYAANLTPSMATYNPVSNYWHPGPQAQFPPVVPPVIGHNGPPFNMPPPPVFQANVPPPNIQPFPVNVNTSNQTRRNPGNLYSRQRQAETTRVQIEKHLDPPVSRQQGQMDAASQGSRMIRSMVCKDGLVPPVEKQTTSQSVETTQATDTNPEPVSTGSRSPDSKSSNPGTVMDDRDNPNDTPVSLGMSGMVDSHSRESVTSVKSDSNQGDTCCVTDTESYKSGASFLRVPGLSGKPPDTVREETVLFQMERL